MYLGNIYAKRDWILIGYVEASGKCFNKKMPMIMLYPQALIKQ